MTNRLLTYVIFLFIFLLGLCLPNILDPTQDIFFILEELGAVVFFALGCIFFLKPVQKKIRALNQSHPWHKVPQARFFRELSYILFATLIVGSALFLVAQVFVKTQGVPKFYQEIISYKDSIWQAQILNEKQKHPHPSHHSLPPHLRDDLPPPLVSPLAAYIFGTSFLLFFLLFGIEEFFDLNERRNQRQIRKQQLLKEQALMKASVLKKQLNPHFMFNSLNVLSGLVREDVDKSERFIQELSQIYRYVLEQSEAIVSSLQEERDFIESYFYLLKIRFENKLIYRIDIPPDKLACKIPSMTLEVLVENTVKHNIVDKNSPLNIEIYIAEDDLVVQNNLQIREDGVTSHGVGLSNLQKRLELLGVEGASFGRVGDSYVARVPLLC